ncbi:MAG TPA: hypothetical protein VFZ93_14225 [Albitalea sp.]
MKPSVRVRPDEGVIETRATEPAARRRAHALLARRVVHAGR